ncbi:phosphopantetheine-binding protein [Pseudomonas sp. FW305-70]|uniref:phosphopantetheine-binding protein n=2 Tax=unclassified Pseudomonas TaxID=196821 RepID=UPI00211428F7|nr:phosphopantetheine-binding protein [Pseudomonas sp. FW305-70]
MGKAIKCQQVGRNTGSFELALRLGFVMWEKRMSDESSDKFDIASQVIKVLSDYFPAGRRDIELTSRLVQDLYVDSISLIEIVMALNETFGIDLPEDRVGLWRTVEDVCETVMSSRSCRASDLE